MSKVHTETVDAAGLRAAVIDATAHGARFAGGWATKRSDRVTWNTLFSSFDEPRLFSCDASSGSVETIVDLVAAADWDEREARDLHGLRFDGSRSPRALVAHPSDPEAWQTSVTGDGVNQVAVGPIHAGVIESGHFRFHVVGERILAMDPRLFYKHRGLERAAAGRSMDDALVYVGRACAACHVSNSTAYAQAVEQALGLWPDQELRRQRTLLVEFERLYNHLHDIGAICAGVGFAPGAMAFAALKDRSQQINRQLTGHRFLFGSVQVGAGRLELSGDALDATRAQLRDLRSDAAAAWRELEFAASMQARLDDVGLLDRDAAERLGAVGPPARAAGLRDDLRTASSRLWYAGFVPATIEQATGDVAARLRIRAAELEASYDMVEDVLAGPFVPGVATTRHEPSRVGVGRVESPRGATTCAVELAAGRIERIHLRTGSYANWPALAHATTDNLLPDFPLINKSFELCYACVDR